MQTMVGPSAGHVALRANTFSSTGDIRNYSLISPIGVVSKLSIGSISAVRGTHYQAGCRQPVPSITFPRQQPKPSEQANGLRERSPVHIRVGLSPETLASSDATAQRCGTVTRIPSSRLILLASAIQHAKSLTQDSPYFDNYNQEVDRASALGVITAGVCAMSLGRE
jgi:hypothetical protein